MATTPAIKALFQAYLDNTCSLADAEQLMRHFATDDPQALQGLILEELNLPGEAADEPGHQPVIDRVYLQLAAAIARQKQPAHRARLWPRIAAAASILLGLSAGGYFVLQQPGAKQLAHHQQQVIVPGSNKAILTLSGGRQIFLTGAKNGQIAKQGRTVIQKTADGQLVYQAPATADDHTAMTYNTMATPRGGQHWVTLADGSKVLLNAASSLTYPTAFKGNERKVTLTGEAYFEVAHHAAQPFRVSVGGQTIEDIGTHFNINAYGDEPAIKTTLIEGSVRITNDGRDVILKPGQQALLVNNVLTVSEANTEEAIAWKNGYFRFNNEKIGSIMRKLSRWYDVDIAYEGNLSADGLNGTISRDKNISQVLEMLALTKEVHFKVAGRKVTVSP